MSGAMNHRVDAFLLMEAEGLRQMSLDQYKSELTGTVIDLHHPVLSWTRAISLPDMLRVQIGVYIQSTSQKTRCKSSASQYS